MQLNFNNSYTYLNINKENESIDIQKFLRKKGFKFDDKIYDVEIIFTKDIIIAMNFQKKL
jgi:hypothetical protein